MSMFTRRHYSWLASVSRDIIAATKPTNVAMTEEATEFYASGRAIGILATALENESPGFDRELFMKNVFDAGNVVENNRDR